MATIQSKKNNVRTQKWRAMISSGVYQDPSLLKARIRKGIPSSIRMMAWPEILKIRDFKEKMSGKYSYAKLVNTFSESTYEINLDLRRTFPEEEDSKILQRSMNNVLKAISLVYPQVGYCQGMNFVAQRVLQVLDDEEAFWLLHYLFEHDKRLMKMFVVDMRHIQALNYAFEQILKTKLPRVKEVFTLQHIEPQIYTPNWFLTLYSNTVPQELFNRIFEVYFIQGWPIFLAVGVHLIQRHEQAFLANAFEDNMYLLKSEVQKITDIDSFMEGVYRLNITDTQIKELTSEYEKANPVKDSKVTSRKNQPSVLTPQQEDECDFKVQNLTYELSFQMFNILGSI